MKKDKITLKVKKRYCGNCGNGFRIVKVGKTRLAVVFKCDECGQNTKRVIEWRGVRRR